MKRIICGLLAVVMLAGCSGSKEGFEKGYGSASSSSAPSSSASSKPQDPISISSEESKPELKAESETQRSVSEKEVYKPVEQSKPKETMGQKNALSAAKNYLSIMSFSHPGLITQLEFEKYSNEDATYAADNCGADWNEQAAKSAKNYLSMMGFSKDGLIEQLEYEGFTNSQAVYGAEAVGY